MLSRTPSTHTHATSATVSILADAKNLIEGLLEFVPQDRLSIPEILNHKWLKSDDSNKNEEYLSHKDCETFEEGLIECTQSFKVFMFAFQILADNLFIWLHLKHFIH